MTEHVCNTDHAVTDRQTRMWSCPECKQGWIYQYEDAYGSMRQLPGARRAAPQPGMPLGVWLPHPEMPDGPA